MALVIVVFGTMAWCRVTFDLRRSLERPLEKLSWLSCCGYLVTQLKLEVTFWKDLSSLSTVASLLRGRCHLGLAPGNVLDLLTAGGDVVRLLAEEIAPDFARSDAHWVQGIGREVDAQRRVHDHVQEILTATSLTASL